MRIGGTARRPMVVGTLVVALMAAWQLPASAGPGDVDGSFGTAGRVTTDFLGAPDAARDVLALPNGKIVAVGDSQSDFSEQTSDFAVARYLENGDSDPSFSDDGRRRTDFDGRPDEAVAVARDADGKLVVVGSSETAADERRMTVVRYWPGGGIDSTLSGDGKVRIAFPGWADSHATDVAIQPDGKIVVAGGVSFSETEGKVSDIAVARFRPNGTLDTGFSGDGKVTTDFSDSDGTTDVVVLPSGKILVAGNSQTPSSDGRFVAVRYLSDGRRDDTFGGDGRVVVNMVPGAFEDAAGVRVRSDGRILIGGWADNAVSPTSQADLALVLLDADGSIHGAFGGGDGKVFRDLGGKEAPVDMAVQDDGKLVFVATRPFVSSSEPEAFWLFRLTSGGAVDDAYGTGGRAEVEFSGYARATAVDIDRDGRAVAAGSSVGDFALTRLQA